MASTSVILARKDFDRALKALNDFGQFHIEDSSSASFQAEVKQLVRQIEGDLADVHSLMKELSTEKNTFMDIFRVTRPVKTKIISDNWLSLAQTVNQEVANLKEETDNLTTQLKTLHKEVAELEHVQDMLEAMKAIGTDLAAMQELKTIAIRVGCAPKKLLSELERALSGFSIIFHSCYMTKDTSFICMAFSSKHESDIGKILKTHHAEIFEIPQDLPHEISAALQEIGKRLRANFKKQSMLNQALNSLGESSKHKLFSLKETSINLLIFFQAKQKFLQSARLGVIKGFVPRRQVKALEETVDSKLKGKALVLKDEVASSADPPTLFRNSRFVKPFEEITKLYGAPHYDELDPTSFIAVMFPLIFGLMFGDVGHGLVLLLAGSVLGFLIKNRPTIKNLCWILAACGLGAIFAGLLYGEFFGMQLFPPLWFNPFDNVLQFLIFSLLIGVAQIMIGLVLELVDFALRRNWIDVCLTSLPKMLFYFGSVYLIAVYGLDFGSWFAGPILIAVAPFVVLVFGKTLFLEANRSTLTAADLPSEPFSLGQRFFESGDLVTRLLSNTMSYARILALLMAHWSLMLVVNTVAGLVGGSSIGVLLSGVVIVAGNLFVIALEGLIVFIHTLRLHFYEWFSKFYRGTGTTFNPFRQSFDHTQIVFEEATGKS